MDGDIDESTNQKPKWIRPCQPDDIVANNTSLAIVATKSKDDSKIIKHPEVLEVTRVRENRTGCHSENAVCLIGANGTLSCFGDPASPLLVNVRLNNTRVEI